MVSKGRRWMAAVVSVGVLVAAGIAVVNSSASGQAESSRLTQARSHLHTIKTADTRGSVAAEDAAAPAEVSAEFGVFGHPAAMADALPTSSAYAGHAARRIARSEGTAAAWALIDGTQVCVTISGTGAAASGPAACTSEATLSKPGQLLVLGPGSLPVSGPPTPAVGPRVPQLLVGLAPNGVSTVTVDSVDGNTATVPVVDNGFEISTDGVALGELKWSESGTAYSEKGF